MRRSIAGLAFAALAVALPSRVASAEAPPQLPPPTATQSSPAWQAAFDAASRKLESGDPAGAAADYSALVASAETEPARALALERLHAASDAARAKGLLPVVDSGDAGASATSPADAPRGPRKRSDDELAVLFLTAPAYAIATGFWLDSLVIKRSPSVGVPLLSLGLTGFAGLAVGLLERGGSFRYGVPQSISTGIVVGTAGGIALGLNSIASDRSASSAEEYRTFTTWTWALGTVGGVTGGILGSTLRTSPGRSAWVGTTALATGLIFGGIAGAASDKSGNTELKFFSLTSALTGAVGLGVGFATAGLVAPSISRVRYIDLAWVSGGAIGVGTCVATSKCNGNNVFAALSIGATIGFAAGFFGTWGMQRDVIPTDGSDPKPKASALSFLEHASPYVSPEANGGVSFGVGGKL